MGEPKTNVPSSSMMKSLNDLQESEWFQKLSSSLNEFNVFEAMGMTRAEIRHSYFLAFLLDPRANHNLGDGILRPFLRGVAQTANFGHLKDLDYSGDFMNTKIERERFHIDILLTDRERRLAVIIENKIDSTEHSGQLARYLEIIRRNHIGWRIVPVFLTPDGQPPSHPDFVPIAYQQIIDILIAAITENRDRVQPSVELAVSHYVSLLRRNIVTDEELLTLAHRIYTEHESAIEFIIRNRQPRRTQIARFLEELIQGTPPLRHLKSPANGKHIQFLDEGWDRADMASDWRPTYRLLLFQFDNSPERVSLHLIVGPANNPTRAKLLEYFRSGPLLLAPEGEFRDGWVEVYSRTFISRQDLQTAKWEEIRSELSDAWDHFIEDDLQSILSAIDIDRITGRP